MISGTLGAGGDGDDGDGDDENLMEEDVDKSLHLKVHNLKQIFIRKMIDEREF